MSQSENLNLLRPLEIVSQNGQDYLVKFKNLKQLVLVPKGMLQEFMQMPDYLSLIKEFREKQASQRYESRISTSSRKSGAKKEERIKIKKARRVLRRRSNKEKSVLSKRKRDETSPSDLSEEDN